MEPLSSAVIFWVTGDPKPQPRPRAFARKVAGKAIARVYDAGTAEGWKSLVVAAGAEHRPATPLECPLAVRLEFRLRRPKTMLTKKALDGLVSHAGRPDLDNLAKAVLDALGQDNWWRDDGQVSELVLSKTYTTKDGAPGARIWIEEIRRP